MKMTIIGAGAIGATLGAYMVRDGHEVLFCDIDQAHVDAINQRGLTIEAPTETFTVSASAVTPEGLPETIDRAIVAVKSHHTVSAADLLKDRLSPEGYILSTQNGLTAAPLIEAVGPSRLVVGFVNFGADYLSPGIIMQGNVATFRVGELEGHEITPRVEELCGALPYAVPTTNILGYLWAKEAYGAMLFAGATSDLTIAESLRDPKWRPLMLALAREVLQQSPVTPEGFDGFEPQDLEGSLDRLALFNERSAKARSGVYRDLMVRHRKTEVDDLLRDLDGPLTTYVGEIIHAIERRERTCEVANLELLATYQRALSLPPQINAIVRVISAPKRSLSGPLVGTPIAVKDIIDIEGLPRGNGNAIDMRGEPAACDAPVIAQLRQSGADIFATTALLEYAAGAVHPEIPETMNPYDPTKTAGGSSGGSAALLAARVCRVALGTDTGGSIRLPAHYCGVVGFKPSHGLLSLQGVTPLSPTLDHLGLLGTTVDEVTKVFSVLTGLVPSTLADSPRLGILDARMADSSITEEVATVIASAILRLGAHGFLAVTVDSTLMEELDQTFSEIFSYEAFQVHRDRLSADPQHFGLPTRRLLLGGAEITRDRYDRAMNRRLELLEANADLYNGVDVLVSPVAPFAAPRTTPEMDTAEGELEGRFTQTYNLTGAPAISLPCGLTPEGMPVGLQLSAPVGSDALLLSVASLAEQALRLEDERL
jgi:2-dehydropantoate 2-reductase